MSERSKRTTERPPSFPEPPTTVERPVKKTQPPPIPARKPPTQPPPIPGRKPPTQPPRREAPMRQSSEHEAAPLPDPPAMKTVALPNPPIIAVSRKSPQPGDLRVISKPSPRELAAGEVRAVSKKSPAPGKLAVERPRPQVKIRAMSEVSGPVVPPKPLGNLAPPRDLQETRARRARELLLWGSISVIIACVIALGIWFAAR